MSINKEKIELRKSNFKLEFKVSVSRYDNEVTVSYLDNYENEDFYDFYDFLNALSKNYRNQIDIFEDFDEKLDLCNKFLNLIQGYKMSFRKLIKDQVKFFTEIELHKDQFNNYKLQFKEAGDLQLSQNNDKGVNYSTKQQILILEYLGAFKLFNEVKYDKQKAQIISSIIGKSYDNTKKALENNNKKVLKGTETKTKDNLEVVRNLFIDKGLSEIVNKIQRDIDTITKG